MRQKMIKKIIACVLSVCLVIPAISYLGTIAETKAADSTSSETTIQIGDTNEDGNIDAPELVRVKKAKTLDQAMQIHMENHKDGAGEYHVVTKDTYSGGKMTFEVSDLPEGLNWSDSWWGVVPLTSEEMTNYSIYDTAQNKASYIYASDNISTDGTFTVNIPDDNNYYLVIGGYPGWEKDPIRIDNVKIYNANGDLVAEDDFDNGFENSIFNVTAEGKDGNTVVDLYTHPESIALQKDADLDGDGEADATDAHLMRQFLIDEIYSFYKADTSSVNNETSKYQVTDELDRELSDNKAQVGKQVGIRYFLHMGTEETNLLYSVSNILSNDEDAYATADAWANAGGGKVGTKHWWGEPLFGYYTSMDKWVVERDVQMLTDAGIDFLAIDTTEGVYTAQLRLLLEVLDKYYDQGFNVPKVTFTSDVSTEVADLEDAYGHLWYGPETTDAIANMSTVRVAESAGEAMSSSAFYGDKTNFKRNNNGKRLIEEGDAALQGYYFEYDFQMAIEDGADVVLVENWNEWLAERAEGTDAEPIVLEANADMENSSDIQPMKDGYGDDYYMQLVDCIKEFKGNPVTNKKLNTATVTESVSIDMTGDLNQWNKVSTHYLDYTDEIGDRDAEKYQGTRINKYAVVDVAKMDQGTAEFVTKNAYPNGTTISFDLYAPKNEGNWWRLRASTEQLDNSLFPDPDDETLLDIKKDDDSRGVWYHFSTTLNKSEEDCYIHFYALSGENEWGDNKFYVDNVKITTPDGKTYTDTFDGESLFEDCDSVSVESTVEVAPEKMAAVNVDRLNDGAEFITKKSYPAGSTVSFKIYVPEHGVSKKDKGWWALCSTESLNDTTMWGNFRMFTDSLSSKIGEWDEYEFTLKAEHGENQYIYFSGAKGEWNGKSFYIDDFTVTSASGEILASEDFNSGLDEYFNVSSAITSVDVPQNYTDTTGRNDISKMKMTSDGKNLYALVETVDAIQGFGEANCMSLFISTGNVGGCWNQYEYVVNRDSSQAADGKVKIEQYRGGKWKEVGSASYQINGNVMQLAIPLETLGCTKSCDLEFKWADNYSEDDIYSFYTQGDVAPYGRVNYVYRYEKVDRYVAITVANLNQGTDVPMNMITSNTYPAGSTIEVTAFQPEMEKNEYDEYPWWSIHFVTENTGVGVWDNYVDRKLQRDPAKMGKWETYSETLPTEGQEYYIFISGTSYEWTAEQQLLIDDIIIRDSEGNILAQETFDNGYSIFDVTEKNSAGSLAVELKEKETTESEETPNQSAALYFENFDDTKGTLDFLTTDSYPTGAKIVFDAYIPSGVTSSYWGPFVTSDPSEAWIWDCSRPEDIPTDQWFTMEYTTTADGQYFAIGGAQTEWKGSLFVDNFRIYNADGELIAKDDFSSGLHNGIFDIDEISERWNKTAVALGTPEEATPEVTYENGVMELTFSDKTTHVSYNSYPAGSTVTFDAKVTTEGTDVWWGIDAIQDRVNDTGVYSSAGDVWNDNPYYFNDWATYTWTLKHTGYIAFEGHGYTKLLVDNIVITSPDGKILAKEDFDNEIIEDSMFEIIYSSNAYLAEGPESKTDILFTAYDSPTISGSTSGKAYALIDEAYGKIAEAGFNKLIPIHEGYTTVTDAEAQSDNLLAQVQWRSSVLEEAVQSSLDLAQKHGLQYYVKDWSFYGLGKAQDDAAMFNWNYVNTEDQFKNIISQIFGTTNSYINHPAYAGSYAMDEPSDIPDKTNNTMENDFQALTWQAKYYNQAMQALKTAGTIDKTGEFFVNLKGANYEHVDDRGTVEQWLKDSDIYSNSRYAVYVDKYVEFAKDQGINYISWDMYPFMEKDEDLKETVEKNYLYNFKIMADRAMNNELKLRYILQSSSQSEGGYRAVTDADLRFQIYTGMAFGVNDFTYFKYSASDTEGNAIFDYLTGETNETLYNYAKEVNHEVHAIEDWFADYKWFDVMAKEGTNRTEMSERMITGVEFEEGKGNNITHGKITSVTASQDTIAGIFEADESTRPNAYMFVNLSDPAEGNSDIITLHFDSGVKGYCVCKDGKQTMVKGNKDSAHTYEFTLEPGAGAFIVPIIVPE